MVGRPSLDTILKNIPLVLDMPVRFSSDFNGRNIIVETPVYAAPAKYVQKQLQIGICRPRKGFEYVPIGLTQRRDFITTSYNFSNGRWKQDVKRKGVVYLPVKLLPTKLDMLLNNKPIEGSPFNIVTLQDLEYDLPFILIEPESEEGLRIHGLYRSKTKRLDRWKKHVDSEEKWLEFVESLKNGEYKHPKVEDLGSLIKTHYSSSGTIVTTKNTSPIISVESEKVHWLVPKSIHKGLNEVVESQHQAKKTFSVEIARYVRGIKEGE